LEYQRQPEEEKERDDGRMNKVKCMKLCRQGLWSGRCCKYIEKQKGTKTTQVKHRLLQMVGAWRGGK